MHREKNLKISAHLNNSVAFSNATIAIDKQNHPEHQPQVEVQAQGEGHPQPHVMGKREEVLETSRERGARELFPLPNV